MEYTIVTVIARKIYDKMSRTCIMPDCNSRYKYDKKYSLFKIVGNTDLRQKWAKVIPGIIELKSQ